MIGIFWDGIGFQFFKFDGTTKPYSFFPGAFSGDPRALRDGFRLPDYQIWDLLFRFIQTRHARLFCGYIASIEAFRDRSTEEGTRKEWDGALKSAKLALSHFRDAESKRQNLDKAGADQTVLQAQAVLKCR